MLTQEEETKLACSMVLLDLVEKNIKEGHTSEELEQVSKEMKHDIDKIWNTLTDEEKNQALERYKQERNSGDLETLPPI